MARILLGAAGGFVAATLAFLPAPRGSAQAEGLRLRLLAEARRSDPDFPDGRWGKLTHFVHVGTLETSDGPISVVDRRAVLTGMLSPRGQNYITFFDRDEKYLGKIHYIEGQPLWCEGGKLYLWGREDLGGAGGNVIDLTAGYRNPVVRSESAYGSSGGTED
jgi:hypothetical protein